MSTNNPTEIIVKGSIFQEREDDYPDPTTLPLPTQEARITEEVQHLISTLFLRFLTWITVIIFELNHLLFIK